MLLYSGRLSLFARKVEIALGEKGLPFERVMVPFTQTEGYHPKHPAVLAANPKGQVPVLIDGDLTLFDSTIIIEYLDEAYPGLALLPRSPGERARCRLLELEADEILLPTARVLFFRTEPPGPDAARRAQLEERARLAEADIVQHHARLESLLGPKGYLCGEFSVADIATFMVVHYTIRNGGPPPAASTKLAEWYRRLSSRPVFAAVLEEIAAADQELSHPITPYGQ